MTVQANPLNTPNHLALVQQIGQALLATCRRRRVDCVDLASQLPRDSSVFYDDAHFTEEGARRVADLVADHLLATPPLAEAVAHEKRR